MKVDGHAGQIFFDLRLDSLHDFGSGVAVVGINQLEVKGILAEFILGGFEILTRFVDVEAYDISETLLVFGEKSAGIDIGREVDGNGGISSFRSAHDVIVNE